MVIKTKFKFEDKVWYIRQEYKQDWTECSFCSGKGKLIGSDGSQEHCPKCYGRKGEMKLAKKREWFPHGPYTVGQIRVCITGAFNDGEEKTFANFGNQEYRREEEYMMRETGIGSGTLYRAEHLFATEKLAKEECAKRDQEGTND